MGTFKLTTYGNFYRFNLLANTNEPLLHSMTYLSKAVALKAIDLVRRLSQSSDAFEARTAKDGQPYFVLKDENGQILGESEFYITEDGRQHAIESARRNAMNATIIEV
ncbi:MAG TPA: YegP family protein [Candidatus Saccharimonadales bacterium]